LGNTPETLNDNYDNLTDIVKATEDRDELEDDFEELLQLDDDQPINPRKRKSVILCRHKLQGQTGYRSRSRRQPTDRPHTITYFKEEDTDEEWAQLRKMEKFLEQQRLELLQQGAQDSSNENWGEPE
jgi:hypothetical protein